MIASDATQKSGLLSKPYCPMWSNNATVELARVGLNNIDRDSVPGKSIYHGKCTFIFEGVDKFRRPLETSAKKLLDVAIVYLSYENFGGNMKQLTVLIPLIEYGEACGRSLTPRIMEVPKEQEKEDARVRERLKAFKERIRRDLNAIQNIQCQMEGGKDGNNLRIISSYSLVRENKTTYIKIVFERNMADRLTNHMFQFPTVLLRLDDRNVNAYAIGRKIAEHNSYDRNAAAGTNNTLKVSTLLNSVSEIQSYEEFHDNKKRKDWKERIKGALEKALNANVDVGFIIHWTYRDAITGRNYTPEEAKDLRWNNYRGLDVDFELLPNPMQDERRKRKQAEHSDQDCSLKKQGRLRESKAKERDHVPPRAAP